MFRLICQYSKRLIRTVPYSANTSSTLYFELTSSVYQLWECDTILTLMDEVYTPPQSSPVPSVSEVPPAADPPKSNTALFVILGLVIVALVTTGAVVWVMRPTKPATQPELAQVAPPSPTLQPLFLKLTSPINGEQAVDGEIIVSGQTLPNTTVLIYTESDQASVESDATGLFETTITLVKGSNALTITAFADNGNESSQSIEVISDS